MRRWNPLAVRSPAISCTVAGSCLIAASAPKSALAQKANLRADLDNLNVRHQTEHYAMAGTVSDARLQDYGQCLEFIYKEYATGFAELTSNEAAAPDDQPVHADPDHKMKSRSPMRGDFGGRFPVIILAKADEYDQFGARYFPESLEHTRGVFLRSLKLLVIRDDSDSSQTYEVLFHEAFHQFAHRFMPYIPTWANEGLATYYGVARPTSSGLRFDQPAAWHFKAVQEARVARALIPLGELMVMDQARFYEREKIENPDVTHRSLCYAQSYALISYMLSDPAGTARLRAYLKELAGAKNRPAAVAISQSHFDAGMLEAMTPHWLTYCQKF